jgi:predicted permease
MRWHHKIVLRVKSLFQRRKVEAELDDEMRFHVEQEVRANIQAGMTPDEARYAAMRLVGPVAVYKEQCREARGTGWIENLARDLRYASRVLRRSPVFTVVAIVTLALGVGANTTIFTVINTILFRPLPVKEPQQLVFFNRGDNVNMSYPDYRDFRDRNDVLSGMTAYRVIPMNMSVHGGKNFRIWGYEATGNYFDMLGVRSLIGRLFHPEDDDKPGAHPVVVLSYSCWQNYFAADPNVADRTVKINGLSYSVLGVAPRSFKGTELIMSPEVWVPMSMEAQIEPGNNWLDERGTTNVWVLGRLKAGITQTQADASLNRIAAQLAHEFPSTDEGIKIDLSPPGLIGKDLRGPFTAFAGVLMGVAGLVLLLACVNLAGMLLARAYDRRKEIAVRLAVGARRAQLVRQLLMESLLLAMAGSAAGFLLSLWLFHLFSLWHPPIDIPANTSLAPDVRVLLFTFIAALVTTFLFGLAPALEATRTDLVPALKNEAISERLRGWRLGDALVAAQIAMSVVLLISSVLVVRSLQHALSLNLGFNPNNAVSVSFDLGLQGYSEQRGRAFQRRLLETVSSIPGLHTIGTINNMPLRLGMSGIGVWIAGKPKPLPSKMEWAVAYDISPGYLRAAGTRLLAGRDIDLRDRAGAPRVALVNETFLRKLLPGENAVGKHFRINGSDTGGSVEIVGVVEDGKYQSLGEDPTLAIFEPLAQHYNAWTTLVARTSLPPDEALRAIRNVVMKMDPELTLFNVGSLKDELAFPLFPARIAASVLGAFGLLAIVLAATGVFGVMATVCLAGHAKSGFVWLSVRAPVKCWNSCCGAR